MYLRRPFSENKIKLVYSNGPTQVHLSCSANDGSNKTVYKTCLKYSKETQQMQASQGRCRSKYWRTAIAKV